MLSKVFEDLSREYNNKCVFAKNISTNIKDLSLEENLTDQANEKSLARAITKIVKNIPEEEFKKTFDKLLERMELCINNHGDYFEHLIK